MQLKDMKIVRVHILGVVLAFTLGVQISLLLFSKKEDVLMSKICDLENKLDQANELLESQQTELENYRDHVKRMQMIAGVKNPDSVFTYREKILNPIKAKNLTKR